MGRGRGRGLKHFIGPKEKDESSKRGSLNIVFREPLSTMVTSKLQAGNLLVPFRSLFIGIGDMEHLVLSQHIADDLQANG